MRIADMVRRANEVLCGAGTTKDFQKWIDRASTSVLAQKVPLVRADPCPEDIALFTAELFSLGCWAEFGYPIFEVSKELSIAMDNTDVAGWVEEINLPFSSLLLPVNPAQRIRWGRQDLRSILVNQNNKDWTVTLYFKNESLISYFSAENFFKELMPGGLLHDGDLEFSAKVRSWVASLVCWLNTIGGKDRIAIASKRVALGNGERVTPKVWKVGRAVKLGGGPISGTRQTGNAKSHLSKQHIVRGHYRNQACGPNMSKRRVVWVKPYMKGPNSQEAWTRIYQAAKKKEPTFEGSL